MSKAFKIIVPSVLALGIGIFIVMIIALRDYPMFLVITTDPIHEETVYYINNQEVGKGKGLCRVNRKSNWTVEAVHEGKKQRIVVWNDIHPNNPFPFARFSINNPEGNELGLKVFLVNDNPELRKEFGCSL